MVKTKGTKKALLLSALSLLLCCSMLIGSTFAWFTDSVTSANNIIKSGNLDIVLEYWDGDSWENVEGKSDILTNTLWEPGVTEVAYLRVANNGSLALKYQLGVNVISEITGVNQAGQEFKLSDHIQFGMIEDVNGETDAYANREDAVADLTASKALGAGFTDASSMEPGDERYLALVVYMPTTVGNVANHNGTNVPTIELGINVAATQISSANEKDSFDEFYDDLATFDDGVYRVLNSDIGATATPDSEVTIKNDSETFIVTATAGENGEVKAVIQTASGKIDNGNVLLSYDIDVTGQKPGSEVTVQLYIGQTLMNVHLYHEGTAMSAADYSYDPVTGYVTLKTSSFSVYDITYALSDYVITSFESIVKGEDGKHVLAGDITTTNIIHFGGGTTVQLDLNGKTITAEKKDQYAFGAQQGSVLYMTGNGTANVGKGFMANKDGATIIIDGGTYNMTATGTLNNIKHHALAQNDSKIVINGGTFTSNVDNACLFFATSNARIEVNGGFFENTADKTPDLFSMGTNKSNTNRIVITGGTFVNWNPLEDRMCYTGQWPEAGEAGFGGPWMLIPGGYTVEAETQASGDVWYTVVPATAAN